MRLKLFAGEIHALIGDHGAGKSTLTRIIAGLERPDDGALCWEGIPVHLRSALGARGLGIATVLSGTSIHESLSVWENVLLALPQRDKARMPSDELIRQLSLALNLNKILKVRMGSLPENVQRSVEIFRALLCQPKVLVLDDAMYGADTITKERIFAVLSQFAMKGGSVLLVSHKFDEIRELCTRCSILRDGHIVAECDPRKESDRYLSRMMVGEELPILQQTSYAPGSEIFQLSDISGGGDMPLRGVNFSLNQREIVGIAGLSGHGQAELLAYLVGHPLGPTRGSSRLLGRKMSSLPAATRRRIGLGWVPPFASAMSYVKNWDLLRNLRLNPKNIGASWFYPRARIEKKTLEVVEQLSVNSLNVHEPLRHLSSGNMQKFVIGREIHHAPSVLLLHDPTVGIETRARAEIYQSLMTLRNQGGTVLLVSSDLDEIFNISDRIMVMRAGRLSPSLLNQSEARGLVRQWINYGWSAPKDEADQT